MHVIYASCPSCEHTRRLTDGRAIAKHMAALPYKIRCDQCGAVGTREEFRAALSFEPKVNALDSARPIEKV